MTYADKPVKIPIEVQVKRMEVMVEDYRASCLNLFHQNMINKDNVEQSNREADAALASLRWLQDNVDVVKEALARKHSAD